MHRPLELAAVEARPEPAIAGKKEEETLIKSGGHPVAGRVSQTRRWMARERRGVGSSLVSMETQF